MTLGASTFADAMGGWAKGCLVLLTGAWLLLALLGVRSGRFPRRLAGGVAFIVGSSLWIGMHGSFAESLSLDAGEIGWWAKSGIADRFGGPSSGSFALSGLGALLLICSVLGLLVAIDWLPLLPFAPLLLKLRDAPRGGRVSGAIPAAAGVVAAPVSDALLRARAAATLERESPAPIVSAEPAFSEVEAEASAEVETPESSEASEASAVAIGEVPDPSDRSGPDWARFRPRATLPVEAETSADLPVDNAEAATHNPGFNPTEERQDDAFASAPSSEPEGKDPPVFERETLETLAPRRKKESEEPDEPKKEEDDEEEKEGEEGEDEDWEEEGEEGEEGDEWEEDDKDEEEEEEEEEETEEEEEEEEWDEDEDEDEDEKDEDEDDKDEDWEEDDEDEKDDKDDDKDEKDDDDNNWEEDKDSSNRTEPQATLEAALDAPLVVAGEELPAEVEILGASADEESEAAEALEASEVTETTETSKPSEPPESSEPVLLELPARLFSDLPEEDRQLVARGVEAVLDLENVSLSRLQRELGVTYYSAARVFERLEKEGFIAPYTGSLAREVRVTRPEWEERRKSS